jgi:D-hexose-6-phosphate mutarotase
VRAAAGTGVPALASRQQSLAHYLSLLLSLLLEAAAGAVMLRGEDSLMPRKPKIAETPGRVIFTEGNGELSKLEINTAWSRAELYLHGAHLTHFQKKDEPPVLFMSQLSRFQEGAPIRGGIPVIFPWFGAREGEAAHGFARVQPWELREISQLRDGRVSVRLGLPDSPDAALFSKFTLEYLVTAGQTLALELIVANESQDQEFTFEDCLHTYFQVGDISAVSVTGLKGLDYLDKVEAFARKTERAEHLKITQETDRVYLNAPGAVEIHDSKLRRRVRVEKSGSLSTVVWNPWVEKAQQMPDFGNEEYREMICVESGNVGENNITLPAGKTARLKMELGTLPL